MATIVHPEGGGLQGLTPGPPARPGQARVRAAFPFPPDEPPLDTPDPTPLLRYERVSYGDAEPERWLVFLHGIFGAGRNWGTVARRLSRARPEWGGLLVDLRQHGSSQGFPPPHTLAAAAGDVGRLIDTIGLPVPAVLGHSFGGKVALKLAGDRGGAGLDALWMIDSTPEARAPEGSAWEMLMAFRDLPGPFASRDAGVAALQTRGVAEPTARWMATNLEERTGGYGWRIDPADMEALLRDFFAVDLWPTVENPPAGLDLHLVKAEESSVLGREACRRIAAAGEGTGRVHLHRVAGGHWVNADSPDALVALLVDGLP